MDGRDASNLLLCAAMARKIRALCFGTAGGIDALTVRGLLDKARGGSGWKGECGGVVFGTGGRGMGELVAEVGGNWRIHLFREGVTGGAVTAYAKEPGMTASAEWVAQDLPCGEAAETLVRTAKNPQGGDGEFAYVHRETHMTSGLVWDPSPWIPAESAYYPDGTPYWHQRCRNGEPKDRGGELPVFENFWPNGRVRILEFGSREAGRSRETSKGPAYSEYYQNGQAAAEIFAERAWDESESCYKLKSGWAARFYRKDGRETTRGAMEMLLREGDACDEDALRGVEDRGVSLRDELEFVSDFTSSINLQAKIDPSPAFISSFFQEDGLGGFAGTKTRRLARARAAISAVGRGRGRAFP